MPACHPLNVYLRSSPDAGPASLVVAPDHEVIAVCVATGTLQTYRSRDGGDGWHPPRGGPTVDNLCMLSLARLRDDRLFLLGASNHAWGRWSDDRGATWSEARLLNLAWEGARSQNDRLLVLPTGRLLLPLREPSGLVCAAALSDDDGRTWHRSADAIRAPADQVFGWPTAIIVRDGVVGLMVRVSQGLVLTFHSHDGGEHWEPFDDWSPPQPLELPFAARNHPRTFDLFMIWHNHSIATNLTSSVCRAGQRFWDCFQMLEEQEDWPMSHRYAQPTLAFDDGGHAAHLTCLEQCPDGGNRLVYRRLPTSWLMQRPSRRALINDAEGFMRGALAAKQLNNPTIRAMVANGFNPAQVVKAATGS